MKATYREVLAQPLVPRILVLGVLGRIPGAALALVLTLHVVNDHGLDRSYAAAGLVTTVMTAGLAIGSTWRGGLIDRRGMRITLIPCVIAEAIVWPLIAVAPYPVLLPLVFVGGIFAVPIFTVAAERAAGMDVKPPFDPRLAALLLVGAAATVLLTATEVIAVASMRSADAETGVAYIFAAWSAASLIGGVVYGLLARGPHPTVLLALLVIGTAPLAVATHPLALLLLICVAGFFCAPVISSVTESIASIVPPEVRGKAMGMQGSAFTIGSAIGTPVAGVLLDGPGQAAAVGVVCLLGGGAVIGATVLWRMRSAGSDSVAAGPHLVRLEWDDGIAKSDRD